MTTAKLNLASNPFRNRVFPWTITALIAVISIVALMFIAQKTFQANAQRLNAERDAVALRQETDALGRRFQEIDVALTPEQKKELKFAHALVDRKRFPWSQLFNDLESVLPGKIKVTRIMVKEVEVQDDRPVADLQLVVASKNPATVTDMIQEMQAQGMFQAQLVATTPQRGKGETGAEYEMHVHYMPRAGFAIDPSQPKPPVDTAVEGGKSR
jgi:Tfp pilus assembly protein PilN